MVKKCKECGDSFIAKVSFALFCSPLCGRRNYRNRKRDYLNRIWRRFYKKNALSRNAKIRLDRKANPQKYERYEDNKNYSGNRKKALERDGYSCVKCGSKKKLHVHHVDNLGWAVDRKKRNNDINNLQTLCYKCHESHHFKEKVIVNGRISGVRKRDSGALL